MVLQLSTSPFVSPKPSSRAVGPGDHTKSASTSIVRLSFLNNTNNGSSNNFPQGNGLERRRHHHPVQPSSQKPKHSDDLLKPSAHDIFSWPKRLLHLISLTSVVFVILYVPTLQTQGLKNGFGGGTQYLTIVGLITTWICMALGLAADILKWPSLTRCKNAILPIVVPAECAVAGLYWALVYRDVYNIYPDGHRYLPFWVDIQMHGLPFIFVLVEMFYYSPTFRVRRFNDFIGLTIFAVAYMCWSSLCAHMDGEWPYPILQNTSCPWERLRLMLVSSAVGLAMHVVISETHVRTRAEE